MNVRINAEPECIQRQVKIKTVNRIKKIYDVAIQKEIDTFVKFGAELVDKNEQTKRISICESNSCNNWNGTVRICNICMCLMDCKTWLKNNPFAFEDEIIKCPKNKW